MEEVPYREIHPMFSKSFNDYDEIPIEIKDALWNYYQYGIDPGSFTMAVLQNDLYNAACKMHPALKIRTLKQLVIWLMNSAPPGSYGTEEKIAAWKQKTNVERRDILIQHRLRPSLIDILKGDAIA